MIAIRAAAERGHFDHGWLDTSHTFSFASYHDPRYMSFRALRVINEDRVQPGEGFGTHAHRDIEILTWVLEGALEHKDSMANGSMLEPGEAVRHALEPGRYAWLQVARGAVSLKGMTLGAGDGAAVSDEGALEITASAPAEVLVFDLS